MATAADLGSVSAEQRFCRPSATEYRQKETEYLKESLNLNVFDYGGLSGNSANALASNRHHF